MPCQDVHGFFHDITQRNDLAGQVCVISRGVFAFGLDLPTEPTDSEEIANPEPETHIEDAVQVTRNSSQGC